MRRFAWIVFVVSLLVTGLPASIATPPAQPDTEVANTADTLWQFKEISANTASGGSESVSRFFDGFTRLITVEPAAEFNTNFPQMLIASAVPGTVHDFTVAVEGRISPGADTSVQGFRISDAILIVDGRWDGRTAVGVGVNCVNNIFGAPLGCTPPAGAFVRSSATFTVHFPTFIPADGLFSFGVGALNCGECFVGYVYEAVTIEPEPELTCAGAVATIGPDSRDSEGVIEGTPGNDVIVGSAGPDLINGRGGDDLICGRGGADVIRGQHGRDRIYGQGGADTIFGGSGNDILLGGKGEDTIRGGSGSDTARGGSGVDRCTAEREFSCERDPKIAGPQVDWTMPDRYGEASADGIIRPTGKLAPKRFTVEFELRRGNGSRCSSKDKIRARSSGATFDTPNASKPCEIVGRFVEGTHRVSFKLTTTKGKGSTTVEVVVQDWLIVGIGDSNGSGEGTPDRPGGKNADWVNKQCHRSAYSHQALAAARLERNDKRTSVTFKHLSCSGAQIATGLLQPYKGIVRGKELPAQLDRLDKIAAKREIDAVLISVGVNDLHFGEMVIFCIFWEDCPNRTWDTFGSQTLDEVMTGYLNALPGLYAQLNDRLVGAEIPADRVYITEYFDSTKDENGVVCNPLIRVGHGLRDFDQAEATWAANSVLRPLNALVRAAAHRYGWNMVTGSQDRFVTHGYCAGARSWIVTREQSKANQGNEKGTLHSTRRGNRYQRNVVFRAVIADFYDPFGNPRKPK